MPTKNPDFLRVAACHGTYVANRGIQELKMLHGMKKTETQIKPLRERGQIKAV